MIRYKHKGTSKPEHSPYQATPKIYGADAGRPLPPDDTDKVSEKRILRIQQVVGGVLYYARAVDGTVLTALSSIASEQAQATEKNRSQDRATPQLSSNKPSSKSQISCL